MIDLKSPCAYQGGKQRLAKDIVTNLLKYADNDTIFYDLCCGSGAVFLELINQGIAPERICAIDKGGFGYFWQAISRDTFDINYFWERITLLPELGDIQQYLRALSEKPINPDTLVYDYLLLQAGAFGSKWIGIDDGKWTNNTFRSYWLPTETSNRRSPVNPMMPLPNTLYERVFNLYNVCKGRLKAEQGNIEDYIDQINTRKNCIVYIDPPYKATAGFNNVDIEQIVASLNTLVFVSEGYEIPNADEYVIFGERKKGNINGTKKKHEVMEILNVFKKGKQA